MEVILNDEIIQIMRGKEVIQIGRKVNENAVKLRLGILNIILLNTLPWIYQKEIEAPTTVSFFNFNW